MSCICQPSQCTLSTSHKINKGLASSQHGHSVLAIKCSVLSVGFQVGGGLYGECSNTYTDPWKGHLRELELFAKRREDTSLRGYIFKDLKGTSKSVCTTLIPPPSLSLRCSFFLLCNPFSMIIPPPNSYFVAQARNLDIT